MASSIATYQSKFNISHLFTDIICSIWLIDRTLSNATTPGQSGSGRNGNEEVLHIPLISKAGASPSNCLMSYSGHSLGKGDLVDFQRFSWCILEPQLNGLSFEGSLNPLQGIKLAYFKLSWQGKITMEAFKKN